MEIDANLRGLRARLKSARPPIALVGAGLSAPMGYPTWNALIRLLHERLVSPSGSLKGKKTEGQSAESWFSVLKDFDKDPLWQAEAYEQALPQGEMAAFIRSTFGPKAKLGEAHRLVGRLPFRHYLTTNFDPSIQQSLREAKRLGGVFTWGDQAKVSNFLLSLHSAGGAPQVVHLHGKYDEPESLVLTERAYVGRYVTSDDARRKLLAIFLTYPVVFAGFSMDDPDLSQIMREVAARLGDLDGTPHHYGIFGYRSLAEKEAIRRRMHGKFGVCVIFYEVVLRPDPKDPEKTVEDHAELIEVLKYLDTGRLPARLAKHAKAKAPVDLADPQKGLWGGRSSAGGFTVTAKKLDEDGRDWVEFALIVRRDDGARFADDVVFHLHDSFDPNRVVVPVKRGKQARLDRWSYGAFTVGVELPQHGVQLEVDLAKLDAFPAWFRNQ